MIIKKYFIKLQTLYYHNYRLMMLYSVVYTCNDSLYLLLGMSHKYDDGVLTYSMHTEIVRTIERGGKGLWRRIWTGIWGGKGGDLEIDRERDSNIDIERETEIKRDRVTEIMRE